MYKYSYLLTYTTTTTVCVSQALVMLHKWVEKNGDAATGNVLERALKNIHREDIIHKCIHSVEQVTDVSEKQAAKAQLGLILLHHVLLKYQ